MADCVTLFWSDPASYNWAAITPDTTTVVGRASNNNFYTLSLVDFSTITHIIDRSSVVFVGDPAVADDGKIYWLETPDFSVYRLMRADIDGTNVTTVASPLSFTPSMAFSFEIPALTYDWELNLFWMATSSGNRLRTITKAGVTASVLTMSSGPRWHNVQIDRSGGVWFGTSTTIYRVAQSGLTSASTATLSGGGFRSAIPAPGGNGVYEDASRLGDDYMYTWNGSSIVSAVADCQLPEPPSISGFGYSFWSQNQAGIFLATPGSGSPAVDAYLWGLFAVTGVPPLRIYGRNDDLATGAPIIPPFRSTWQTSGRLRQAAGHA